MDSSEGAGLGRSARMSRVTNALVITWVLLFFMSLPISSGGPGPSSQDPAATRPVAASSDPLARWTTRRSIRPALPGVTVAGVP
jgi:hypothetical protein